MSSYSGKDLSEDWEFKILRSAPGRFNRPEVLKQVLQAEARAGWVLVEKFDDYRVRLKRPASAKASDATLPFDPYRTQVGPSAFLLTFVIAGLVMALILGVTAFFLLIGRR